MLTEPGGHVRVPQYLLDACGGDEATARRITGALRPIIFKLRSDRNIEASLRIRLVAVEEALNRSLSALAECQEGVPLDTLVRATERDVARDIATYEREGVPQ